jgi:hypothetical protein
MYKSDMKIGELKAAMKKVNAFEDAFRAYLASEDKDEAEKEKAMNEAWSQFCSSALQSPDQYQDHLSKVGKEKVGEIVKGFFTSALTLIESAR